MILRVLYEEYNAYCLVVNPSGRTVFFPSILEEHKELQANFDANYIVETIQTVMNGNELKAQKNTNIAHVYCCRAYGNKNRVVGADTYKRPRKA